MSELKYRILGIGGKISAYTIFLVLITISCRKDKVMILPDSSSSDGQCIPIPAYTLTGFGYNYLFDEQNVTQPCFNPNNPDEFCFVRAFPGGYCDLFVYNAVTQLKTKIWSGILWSPVKWGENDWLIFGASQNIFKIKSTGDDLTQLTTTNNCYFPIWGATPDYFMCAFQYDVINQPYSNNLTLVHGGKYSSQGVLLDTIKQSFSSRASINQNGIIAGVEPNSSDYSMILVDINNSNKTVLKTIKETSLYFKWVDNISFIWADISGMYRTNSNNGETVAIKKTCNSEYYRELDYNESSNKIICSKISQKLVNPQTIEFKERIVMMNLDGSEEQEINLN